MHDILRHIGGPRRSRRKYCEQMLKTLRKDFGASEIQDFDNATREMALYFK